MVWLWNDKFYVDLFRRRKRLVTLTKFRSSEMSVATCHDARSETANGDSEKLVTTYPTARTYNELDFNIYLFVAYRSANNE
jgi:hypothetical protein